MERATDLPPLRLTEIRSPLSTWNGAHVEIGGRLITVARTPKFPRRPRRIRKVPISRAPVSPVFSRGRSAAASRSSGLEGSIIHWRIGRARSRDREIVFGGPSKEKKKRKVRCSGSRNVRSDPPSLPGDADSCEGLKIQDRHYSPVRPRVQTPLSQPWEEFARDRETSSSPSTGASPPLPSFFIPSLSLSPAFSSFSSFALRPSLCPSSLPPRTCSRSFSLFIPRNQPRLYTRSLATCNRGERVREGPRETCGNRRNNRAMVSRGTSVYPVLLGNNKLRQRWIAVTPIIIRVYFWYLTAPIGIRFFFLSSPATFLSARWGSRVRMRHGAFP